MTDRIDAILFDMGGTLRRSTKRGETDRLAYIQKILERIGADAPAKDFMALITSRQKAYRKWAKQALTELNESDLWTRWMLPDYPAEKIAPMAVELNQFWRDAHGIRAMLPEARQTVLGLFRRGYRLGLVSNTTSSVEVPAALEKEGIAGCFDAVILSCVVGKRKPGPDILLEAADRMEVRPERCAYIGDRPDRDVAAARRAGFARTVILRDPNKPFKKPVTPDLEPDYFIDSLTELLGIFPARSAAAVAIRPLYDISLSTMWGIKKFAEMGDFMTAAARLGLSGVELNHQVTPAMLDGLDLRQYPIRSIHEPCPAAVPADVLKKQDRLISSPDEERRREGVNSIRWSIDLARALHIRSVVVHAGMVQFDPSLEKRLVALFDAGKANTPEYLEVKDRMEEARRKMAGPYLEAVQKSLAELLEYAGAMGVRLGLENRYHYFDIPSQEELALLLGLADMDRLGFIYDTGHAHAMESLGFYLHEDWLKRFAERMLGTHLHDAIGTQDHLAPGLGEIDFEMAAKYLPEAAFRTLEVQPHNSNEQIKDGLKILANAGCIRPL